MTDEEEPGGDGRPVIRIFAGFLHETVDMAEGALMQAGLGYYQRGSIVVHPAGTVAIADGRKIDAPRLVDVKAHHMAKAVNRPAIGTPYWSAPLSLDRIRRRF